MNKLLFLVLGGLLFSCSSNTTKEVKPFRGDIVQAVYSSATVRPYNYYTAYSTISGFIQQRYVEEGDTVFRGKPLFTVESKSSKLNVDNSVLVYELASSRLEGNHTMLNELDVEINNAELKFSNDSLNYFRQKTLFSKGVGTANDVELRKLQYGTTVNTLQILRNKYKRTVDELKLDAKMKQNQLKTNKLVSRDLLMTSNIDGRVYDVLKEEGEFISMQEPFAVIGSADLFKVELLIDEVDVANISLGQKVIVSLNAYPNEVFEAKVMKIYPMMDTRTQSFKVDCDFVEVPGKLYMGLSGEANVVVQEKENVVLIPKEYIVDDTLVSTVNGLLNIKPGIVGFGSIESLSGIDTTVQLLLPE